MSETTAPAVTLVEFLERRLDELESGWKAHKRREDEGDEEKLFHFGRRLADELLTDIQVKRRILTWCSERDQIYVGKLGSNPEAPRAEDFVPGDFAHREDAYVLRLLALPYAGHPDYRPEWRP